MAVEEIDGWLLDLYADPDTGHLAVWLIGANGVRYRSSQRFPITFYAAGPTARLRELWIYLKRQPIEMQLARAERRELFTPYPLTVLAARVEKAAEQPRLFRRVARDFPDLDYYDADLPLLPRYAAHYNVFPLTRCRAAVDRDRWIADIAPCESRWALDPDPPPLRMMTLAPDTDPAHRRPSSLHVACGRFDCHLTLQPAHSLLINLTAILNRYDPDLLLTDWGDTWVLPRLLALSRKHGIPLPLSRDATRKVTRKADRTYLTYGQIVYRGEQVLLHGRLHVDRRNAMMFGDYGLEGAFELARVSGLPVQVAARNSPGAGITAMQIITAMRQGILVPYRKQQAERLKSAGELIAADQGGLVFNPTIGLFTDVAEIDFVSMYPAILRKFNLSPECMDGYGENMLCVPGTGLRVSQDPPGLLPATISPLLDKRIAIKQEIANLHHWDCRRASYKARAAALKWLLVVCFGYTGYRNAKFGRIEAHQAITAYAREILLRAKETAEEQGYEVLHLYIDCLWVRRLGASRVADFQPLMDAVAKHTGLPIALDGVFKWVAFLPSRMDGRVGVANRYFGVFQSGEVKLRGIEARRRDTPAWIAGAQAKLLDQMARADTTDKLAEQLPEVVAWLRRNLAILRTGCVPVEDLVLRQRLSREVEKYRSPSPAARAAAQLAAVGKSVAVGQSVRFVYTRGEDGVTAWDLPGEINPRRVDVERYSTLLLRAVSAVLQPFGVDEVILRTWLAGSAPIGLIPVDLPLLSIMSSGFEDRDGY